MRVALNQLAGLKRRAGVGHYAAELARALQAAAGAEAIATYPEGWVRRGCESFFRNSAVSAKRCADAAPRWRDLGRTWVRSAGRALVGWHFRRFLKRQRFDLYHEPNFIPLACDVPTVVTVHDLSVLTHPEWHQADRVRHFERHFLPRLAQCSHVLTVTDAIRDEVIDTLGLPPAFVSRAHHGVRATLGPAMPRDVARVRAALGLPGQYLLHVGTLEPRKNLQMLLRAYCRLPAATRERCGLVLAGAWGWNTAELAAYYENDARPRGVMHVGYVADQDLAALYSGACALVFPTYYEGFGFPALEMMACGGAVLASDTPAVVEVAGRRAHYLAPNDADAWRAAMQRVIEDMDWRRMLRRGVLEHARQFSWERCAAETLQAYHAALGEPAEYVVAAAA